MTAFDDLLSVQDHDAAIDRLRHRLDALPERVALATNEKAQLALAERLADAGARATEAARAQQRVEDDLAGVQAKIAEVERRLYSGAVAAPRELQAMQADVESLK